MSLLIGQVAIQSSFWEYSHQDDPLRAISGVRTGSYSFHTEIERDPWWMVDLGCICKIEKIVVYNREDKEQSRARFFSIEIFDPALGGWNSVYNAENEFGGFSDDNPLRLNFGSKGKMGRYIKLAIIGHNYLHLDQVQIFGNQSQKIYENFIKTKEPLNSPPLQNIKSTLLNENSAIGAIVGLVRGYDDIEKYDTLIARNAAIFEKINKHKQFHYPLLIWHEGNISEQHQDYIISKGQNQIVHFIDISKRFKLPQTLTPDDMEEHWPIGYRLMCKFNSFDIWELSEGFDYVMRIDEDCIISEIVADPFTWMRQADLDVGFSSMTEENHKLTNDTFACFVEAFFSVNDIRPTIFLPPGLCCPYSNFMMARVGFFRSDKVWNFLSQTVAQRDFYIKRWGDLVVLGVPLYLYSSTERVQPIEGLQYKHHSHNNFVVANDDLRTEVLKRCYFDPDILGGLSDAEQERELLRLFKEWPINGVIRSNLARAFRANGRNETADRLISPINAAQPSQMLQVIPLGLLGEGATKTGSAHNLDEPEPPRRVGTPEGSAGLMEITLPTSIRISVDASVNEAALARVLRAIRSSS